ncbi:pyocin S6 family toxin immunity protein [Pseudomonas putida]|uniref:pyocin S6 family toxin immunity protein n=1 Tax=Pseudomonas putida TaxID=303 RepID=UPI002366D8B4|nr:pyocin S6 family toxin immunity protein [Pseudomonas putida]MDD2050166.1 pyocin S6 family toxin immunity protein [Pseudomonas putida]
MFLCIEGFFPDSHENQFVQFELDVAPEFNQAVLEVVGWESLQAGVKEGVVDLTTAQITQIEMILGRSIPRELDICISVLA